MHDSTRTAYRYGMEKIYNVLSELENGTPPPPIPREGWGKGEISSQETLPLTPTLHEPEYVDGMEDVYTMPTEAQPQKSWSNNQHACVCDTSII